MCVRKRKVQKLQSESEDTDVDICRKKRKVNKLESDSETDAEVRKGKRKERYCGESSQVSTEKIKQKKRSKAKHHHDENVHASTQRKRQKSEYAKEEEVKRTSDGTFACPKCDFTGKSSGKVYTHMAENHGMEKFECDYCKFNTGNKTSMANHKKMYCRKLKNTVTDSKKLKPDGESKMEITYKRVDGKANFCCPKCDFVGLSEGKVYSHLCEQHGFEKFICTYCNFQSANKTSMQNHKKLYCVEVRGKKKN